MGLGPSMFLLQVKAVTILFLILSIINIPIFVFYAASNEATGSSMLDIFMQLSLGNIGQRDYSCMSLNYATDTEIKFSCSSNFAKLTKLQFIGVTKDDETQCATIQEDSAERVNKDDAFVNKCYMDDTNKQRLFT